MQNTQHTLKPGFFYTNGLSITQILDEAQTLAFKNGCTREGDAIMKNGTLYRQRAEWENRLRSADVAACVRHLVKVYRAAFAAGSNDAARIQQLVTDLCHRNGRGIDGRRMK